MKLEDKLRELLKDFDEAEKGGAKTVGVHLRDEDFIRLLKSPSLLDTNAAPMQNGDSLNTDGDIATLRRHLINCDSCLKEFQDFYAFFAPAAAGEAIAGKSEIDEAWQAFAPRVAQSEKKPTLWTRLFSFERSHNYFAAFGWGFAALFLLFTGISAFVAWQAKNENTQLAALLEEQKQMSEERLKTLEKSAQNQDLAEQEKTLITQEKDDLQKRIAVLQTEIERARQQKIVIPSPVAPQNSPSSLGEKPDNSLVAVNTPIYDVFPADSVVRGGAAESNKFVVPNAAKNIVLILNAAGRADSPIYQAALINGAGKIVWRGGGLRKDAAGNFTLTLSRTALKAGNYRLKLFGDKQSGSPTIAEYPITIEIGK